MDLAENRFGKTWKHFLEVLKVDYNCSLADVCRDQHTTFGMSSWMSRRGYSVKQAKANIGKRTIVVYFQYFKEMFPSFSKSIFC